MTNGDKIRHELAAMSDEDCAIYACKRMDCRDCPIFKKGFLEATCVVELEKWMGQEAKDE
jgi:hypothetical protein